MNTKNILYRMGKSVGQIALLLMILVGIPALGYWLWSPGSDFAHSSLDRGKIPSGRDGADALTRG